MKTPTFLDSVKISFDTAILYVLPFPALIFNITSSRVLTSNSFFNNESDTNLYDLLNKAGFYFIHEDDILSITQVLSGRQDYNVHKINETPEEISTYSIHANLMPDQKSAFLYINLLSSHKQCKKNSENKQNYGLFESSYRFLIDQLPLGVYRINTKGKFIYANKSLANILEYDSANDLYKISVSDLLVDKNNRMHHIERWKKAIVKSEEVRLRTKNGNLIHVKNIRISILNKAGEIEYFDGIIEDISEKITMEKELTKAWEQALEADNLKTTFLTNVSHEIRTPMNSILGFSSMLKEKGINPQKRDLYLDIIISRGHHLMQIINDILDITRIEGHQIQVISSPVILNNLLDRFYNALTKEINNSHKNVKVLVNKPLATEDSQITTDDQHLEKIFSLLLNNALKFTDKGIIEFGYLIKNNQLIFFVKDTGIGIQPQFHQLIFERFRQVDESFTRDYGGLGLGLAICKGLVDLMHGKIWVESDGKNGSTFYFTLNTLINPLLSEINADRTTSVPVNSSNLHGKTILVVEDDFASSEYLNAILSSEGCKVIHAKSGPEAMKIFKQTPAIDLILLDLQIPGMNGYQIAQNIRAHNKEIPIIAQTAHDRSENKQKCLEVGFNQFLTKPIHLEVLLSTLKVFLS